MPTQHITVKTQDQVAAEEEQKAKNYRPNRFYSAKLDAYKKGNFTRFINHSEKPNMEAKMVCIPKNPYRLEPSPMEIVYVVKRKILPGQQLLVSYEAGGKTYWKASNIKPFPMVASTFQLDSELNLVEVIS